MTDFDWPAFIANSSGLLGVALLALPALHVSRYALKAAQLNRLRPRFRVPRLRQQVDTTIQDLHRIRDSWNRGKATCLIAGVIASATSYAIPVIVSAPAAFTALFG